MGKVNEITTIDVNVNTIVKIDNRANNAWITSLDALEAVAAIFAQTGLAEEFPFVSHKIDDILGHKQYRKAAEARAIRDRQKAEILAWFVVNPDTIACTSIIADELFNSDEILYIGQLLCEMVRSGVLKAAEIGGRRFYALPDNDRIDMIMEALRQ